MPEREPIDVKNLDIYGDAPLLWSRAHEQLSAGPDADWTPDKATAFFLNTVRPDGHPHSAPFGAMWHDGDIYIVSGPQTRKSRNLEANPACTIAVSLNGIDVVLEGGATRVTDAEALETLAGRYREGGWPAEVEGDAFTAPYSAPSAGPPPWHLYQFRFHTVFGVATREPNGATRWRFED